MLTGHGFETAAKEGLKHGAVPLSISPTLLIEKGKLQGANKEVLNHSCCFFDFRFFCEGIQTLLVSDLILNLDQGFTVSICSVIDPFVAFGASIIVELEVCLSYDVFQPP